ncbi:MAG: hypothetical protein QM756_45835 [Polyangiaceae bacterium]
MKRKAKAPRPRTLRRADERAARALAEDRERLFQLERGGAPERPLEVGSASVVEVQALALRCPRCDGPHDLVEHNAVTAAGARLRQVLLACRQCGSRRAVYFRLREELPN